MRRRSLLELPDGSYADLYPFARPASDQVGGSHGFSSVMNLALPKERLIAHVLMRDEQDRVPLCETQFTKVWELPGGIVEPLEQPWFGAAREVREELGIDLQRWTKMILPIGRCSRRRSRRSSWSTWLRQVSLDSAGLPPA